MKWLIVAVVYWLSRERIVPAGRVREGSFILDLGGWNHVERVKPTESGVVIEYSRGGCRHAHALAPMKVTR